MPVLRYRIVHAHRLHTLLRAGLTLFLAAVAGTADLFAQGERFVAYYGDGSTLSGPTLHNSYKWSFSTNVSAIGTEPISRGAIPVRCIRDTRLRASLVGPYVLFANGDILPGRVAGVAPADLRAGRPQRMIVNLTPPLTGCKVSSSEVEVRIDRVARVVSDHGRKRAVRPGTLWLNDGRVVEFKAIRWSEGGFKALTDTDIVKATYAELQEYHARAVDPAAAILEDSSTPCPEPDSPLIRFRVSNGGALTGREALLIEAGWSQIAVKPSWAFSGVRFGPDDVVSRGYRSPFEVPLSLLRAELLDEHSFTGFLWPWQLNASVRGGELCSGGVAGALGVGTHAFNALAFDLPPGARSFATWVGLDQAVGAGGCVRCSVFADNRDGKPLWQSCYLRGSEPPVRVDLADIGKFKRLILVTDFGHEGRPKGADPLDIRDEVNWIDPTVRLAELPEPETRTHEPDVFAQIAQWDAPAGFLEDHTIVPVWRWGAPRCTDGVYVELPKTVRLKRRLNVSLTNSWLQISVARGRVGGDGLRSGHTLTVLADGRRQEPINTHRPCTSTNLLSGHVRRRQWGLGEFVGRDVSLEVVISPEHPDRTRKLPGLVLVDLYLGPVVDGLPGAGKDVIHPDVPIASLNPRKATLALADARLQSGKLSNGQPLSICKYAFKEGYGIPAGSELVYGLDPSWRRFVAVLGMNREVAIPREEGREFSYEVGPFRILLDGEPHWQSSRPETFGLWDRALQIDVEIPAGHRAIALQVPTGHCYAVWACCGFMKE